MSSRSRSHTRGKEAAINASSAPEGSRPRMRVAVVGSGLAGLTAAYLLDQEGADVWLLEKSDTIGFHSASVDLGALDGTSFRGRRGTSGKEVSIGSPITDTQQQPPPPRSFSSSSTRDPEHRDVLDVPMRSFQGGYYPLLIALYRHLGLTLLDHVYTFSFSHLSSPYDTRLDAATYFTYEGASGQSIPTLPHWSTPLDLFRALRAFTVNAFCYLVFLTLAVLSWHGFFPRVSDGSTTLGELVASVDNFLTRPVSWIPLRTPLAGWFPHFAESLLVPLFSAVGTMTSDDVWATPARAVLDYVYLTVGTSHYILGSASARTVAQRLVAPLEEKEGQRVRLGTRIQSLRYNNRGAGERTITVVIMANADAGREETEIEVDKVVIATQPGVAAALLGSLEPSLVVAGDKGEARRVSRMRKALGEVESRETIVVTHTDFSVLPPAPDRRSINFFQPRLPVDAHARPPTSLRPSRSSSSRASSRSPPPLSPSTSTSTSPSRPRTPLAPAEHGNDTPFFPPKCGAVYTMATHVARTSPTVVLQTTNPVVPIDPESVLSISKMDRALPLRKPSTLANIHPPATGDHPPLVYLAGSYAYPGIPLLEGCVGSAKRVVAEIVGGTAGAKTESGQKGEAVGARVRRNRLQGSTGVGNVDWDKGRNGWLEKLWVWRMSAPST